MEKFIDKITDLLLNGHTTLQDWVVVVPSQRATRYIQESIYNKVGKPVLSPEIVTIHQFFEHISPRLILDQSRLLFQLYKIYTQYSSDKEKSFDMFYNWGKILLSDFEEVDRYMVDSKQLFRNLKDIKEIESWSFNSEELTSAQKEFMRFWLEIGIFYDKFEQELKSKGEAFMGMAVKEVAENVDFVFKKYPQKRFLFAGFNAHSPVELSIIKQLKNLGRAEVLFDTDLYYLHQNTHEAGTFIRKNLAFLDISKKEITSIDEISNKAIEIEIIACAQTTGQVKAAATILESQTEEQTQQTLVLLADENLLVPFLKNIPQNVQKANITLGLSLNNSILKTWIELLFSVQKGFIKTSSAYYKDIFEICYHPFVTEILSEQDKQRLVRFEDEFKRNNLIYVNVDKLDLPDELKDLFKLIYMKWQNDWVKAIVQIREVNSFIYNRLKEENEYEKALMETFDLGIIDLQNCLEEEAPEMNISTFKNLFTQHYSSQTISYFGNPTKGLQVMGLLETRMLDFKRIICIGMNEKNLPPANNINSLIPIDLRNYFKMATLRDKQGIFAHHFYRLLHQAEQLYITYSTNNEGFNSSEKSRYIRQLELELTLVNPNIKIRESHYVVDNKEVNINERQIEKDSFVVNRVNNYLQSASSASGLKNFYTCPLDFFYRYILKIGNELKVEEDIEASTFGSLIHATLQRMYDFYANHTLGTESTSHKIFNEFELEKMVKASDIELRKSFMDFFKTEVAFDTGKNRLNFEMASHLLKSFFEYERNHLREIGGKIVVESVEEELFATVPTIILSCNGENKPLRIKGFIDRLDYYDGGYHIIDYKSGKVEAKDYTLKLNKEGGFEEEDIYLTCVNSKYFMQGYFYLYLFYQNFHEYPKSITFVSFVNPKDVLPIIDDGNFFSKLVDCFPKVLQMIVDDILDINQPFKHKVKNAYSDYCEYCH